MIFREDNERLGNVLGEPEEGRVAPDRSQIGRVIRTVASHTSVRMRMVGPSVGERTGVRTGEARTGMENMGA